MCFSFFFGRVYALYERGLRGLMVILFIGSYLRHESRGYIGSVVSKERTGL